MGVDDRGSDIHQNSSQHSNLYQATVSYGEGGIFKGAIYPGVRVGAGVVTENDCATNGWSRAEVRTNFQLKNTTMSKLMATESKTTAESEVGGGETESESDSNLMSRHGL